MSVSNDESKLELVPPTTGYRQPPPDRRKHIPEPPPVRLMAIEDVQVVAADHFERELDEFYVAMLQFERDRNAHGSLVYRAENFRLMLQIQSSPIERLDMRPIGVEVLSLVAAEAKIIERELEYQRIKGLTAGSDQLMLQDPAGNWVSITERRNVR